MNRPKKLLYFDVETTGLNPAVHDIIQLSGIIEYDGRKIDGFNFNVRPLDFEVIDPNSLKVTGKTIEELKEYPEASEVYFNLLKVFEAHINRYDRDDKFIPVAYNGKFDMDFLINFFMKHEDKYFGSWLSWDLIDPMAIARYFFIMNNIPIENFTLSTVCDYFKIPLVAHDSMNDIIATREVLYRLNEIVGFNSERIG